MVTWEIGVSILGAETEASENLAHFLYLWARQRCDPLRSRGSLCGTVAWALRIGPQKETSKLQDWGILGHNVLFTKPKR